MATGSSHFHANGSVRYSVPRQLSPVASARRERGGESDVAPEAETGGLLLGPFLDAPLFLPLLAVVVVLALGGCYLRYRAVSLRFRRRPLSKGPAYVL